jgi:predicted TIM-barrel fold metal-dependent hydrolase
MRFNCHAHIFNFRSVFTPETISILVRRLSRERWPEFVTRSVEKVVRKHLKGEWLDENVLLAEFASSLKADKALKKLIDSGVASLPPSVSVALEGDIAGLPVGALREMVRKIGSTLRTVGESDARASGEIEDILDFLAIGIKPSIPAVAARLLEDSGRDTAVVALMMDITAGKDADDDLFQSQIDGTAEAVLAHPGRILPFVAVNTNRSLHFERMTHALEERGFVGVKMYPSLGYKVDSPEMRRVYKYCVAHDTPVLLHCSRGGFFRDDASIEFGDPAHWGAVLADFPELRVCFGHFGGDENLVAGSVDPDSWSGRIVKLMERHPHVYADISYHDDPMDGGENEENYFRHLGGMLDDDVLGSRILFGSDFHLVRQRVRDDNLWRFFANRFSAAHFKRITETNPVAYLGLPRDSGGGARANVVRHLRYIAKYNFEVREEPAEWVQNAIRAEFGAVRFFPNEFGRGWSRNNEAHFYTDLYFRDFMSRPDAGQLSFEQAGHVRMRDLRGWPSLSLPAETRPAALRQIATGLQAFLTQTPEPAAVLESDVTNAQARKALLDLLDQPDTRIADFGPAVDTMYRFKSEPVQA